MFYWIILFLHNISMNTRHFLVTPPCLTPRIFEEKFLKEDNPMVIYTSAQVEIYSLTKNKCTTDTIIENYWNIYSVNRTTGTETKVRPTTSTIKFIIKPGSYDVGTYRLHIKIGYPPGSMEHWMEESMYIKIMHPPPHAFIKGGSGKNIGKGIAAFDARSVSYRLANDPGDPSGLTFEWRCLKFITKHLYKLLQLSINPTSAFNDETGYERKWYHSGFTEHVNDQVAWIDVSTLYERVTYLRNNNATCSTADEIYIKVTPGSFPHITSDNNQNDTAEDTTVPNYDLVPLNIFYNIMYLKDFDNTSRAIYSLRNALPLPVYTELVTNELFTFLEFYYGTDTSPLSIFSLDFFQRLSESFLTLQSISRLEGLDGLPASADATFFENLTTWLQIASEGTSFAETVSPLLTTYEAYISYIYEGVDLINYIGIDGYMQLYIDEWGTCLLNFLGELFEGFYKINQYDWFDMRSKERFYLQWIEDELFQSSECELFDGFDNGTGRLNVTEVDVILGIGYLVNVRVEFNGSISYFVQYAQSVSKNPTELHIE